VGPCATVQPIRSRATSCTERAKKEAGRDDRAAVVVDTAAILGSKRADFSPHGVEKSARYG